MECIQNQITASSWKSLSSQSSSSAPIWSAYPLECFLESWLIQLFCKLQHVAWPCQFGCRDYPLLGPRRYVLAHQTSALSALYSSGSPSCLINNNSAVDRTLFRFCGMQESLHSVMCSSSALSTSSLFISRTTPLAMSLPAECFWRSCSNGMEFSYGFLCNNGLWERQHGSGNAMVERSLKKQLIHLGFYCIYQPL